MSTFEKVLKGTPAGADLVDAGIAAVAGAEAASGIGAAKLTYDALSTAAAIIDCKLGIIK